MEHPLWTLDERVDRLNTDDVWRDGFSFGCEAGEAASAVPPAVLRALCTLFMADDGTNKMLADADDRVVRKWLDAQARAQGFDSWVAAYHDIPVEAWEGE
jgi:hypothetical protein